MAVSGIEGNVAVNGSLKTASKWTADLKQAAVNRGNFTTGGEPLNAAGQRTGNISMSGPYEGTLGVVRGTVYTFTLYITAAISVVVAGRVTGLKIDNDAEDGPQWEVTAEQYGAATVNV